MTCPIYLPKADVGAALDSALRANSASHKLHLSSFTLREGRKGLPLRQRAGAQQSCARRW